MIMLKMIFKESGCSWDVYHTWKNCTLHPSCKFTPGDVQPWAVQVMVYSLYRLTSRPTNLPPLTHSRMAVSLARQFAVVDSSLNWRCLLAQSADGRNPKKTFKSSGEHWVSNQANIELEHGPSRFPFFDIYIFNNDWDLQHK